MTIDAWYIHVSEESVCIPDPDTTHVVQILLAQKIQICKEVPSI